MVVLKGGETERNTGLRSVLLLKHELCEVSWVSHGLHSNLPELNDLQIAIERYLYIVYKSLVILRDNLI